MDTETAIQKTSVAQAPAAIKAERARRSLSQAELGLVVGMSREKVSEIERGILPFTDLRFEEILALEAALGLSFAHDQPPSAAPESEATP